MDDGWWWRFLEEWEWDVGELSAGISRHQGAWKGTRGIYSRYLGT